jgi:glycosyltransferase involved in cell wall biosynthesis
MLVLGIYVMYGPLNEEAETLMITRPRLSIGIPLRNSDPYLESLLDSLQEQTFTNFEILLLDQASSDWTSDICREYCRYDPRLRYFYLRKGQHSVHYGIQVAFALDYWMWTGQVTFYPLKFLELCVTVLDKQPEKPWYYAGTPASGMIRIEARRSLAGNMLPRAFQWKAGRVSKNHFPGATTSMDSLSDFHDSITLSEWFLNR